MMRMIVAALLIVTVLVAGLAAPAVSAEYMEKSQQMMARSYSPGVLTDGGRIVWLAGQTGFRDEQGKDVVGSRRKRGRRSRTSTRCSRRRAAASPTW